MAGKEVQQTTRRYIPEEDNTLHNHHCDNPIFYMCVLYVDLFCVFRPPLWANNIDRQCMRKGWGDNEIYERRSNKIIEELHSKKMYV
jgi:hypothetical protein